MGTVASSRSDRSKRLSVRRTFDPKQDPACEPRRLVRQTLVAWGQPSRVDDAVQVVAEMVANALDGGPYTVIISLEARTNSIHIVVQDNRPGLPTPQKPSDDSENGRGLLLIDALADQWGFSEHLVWARFTW